MLGDGRRGTRGLDLVSGGPSPASRRASVSALHPVPPAHMHADGCLATEETRPLPGGHAILWQEQRAWLAPANLPTRPGLTAVFALCTAPIPTSHIAPTYSRWLMQKI